jgi:hypothetical protein
MSDLMLVEPVELTDAELDLVTGGQSLVQGGLVNIGLNDTNIAVLSGLTVNVNDSIKDIANNNNLSVGAIVQLLGGGAAILQRQAQA